MTAIDVGLAGRVEAWIDAAGHSVSEVESTVGAALAAGFARDRVRVVVDPEANAEPEALVRATDFLGVVSMSADVSVLNARLAVSESEFLFVIRWGTVSADIVPTVVAFLDRFPEFDLAYGDSVTAEGVPLLRPAASPLRLRSNDYLGPVVVARTAALLALGGLREEARRAQMLDVALRASEAGRGMALVPSILATEAVLGRDFSDTDQAQREVVAAAFGRSGITGEIEVIEPFVRRIRYRIEGDPLVSIVIPTRGGAAEIAGAERVLVVEAVRGIVERSSYTNVEFVIVVDAETPESVIVELERLCGDRLRLVLWDAPFNFSAKMNRGAVAAAGEYLLLLNDDVEIVTDDWIETMLGLAQQSGVGIVGAELYFEDSTVQHAGQVYTGGVAGHAAFGWPGGRDDSIKSMVTDHEVSGVTAACAMLSRALYFEIGGFTLELPGNYNDVDLNMKIRSAGYSAVFTPWARLYHFESKTRDPKVLPSDIRTLQARWRRRMQIELYSRML